MSDPLKISSGTHVVDVLGNIKGRDQPIMLMEQALNLVSLLGKEVLISDDVVFFDPFCKAGEILLACAMSRLWHKAEEGKKILSLSEIQKELYGSNRYFAMSPDERHHKLSLRTFLGNENSHKDQYVQIIRDGHYLSEIDGRLNKEKFEQEFNYMLDYIQKKSKNKKIIAVGNPPYQESDGGAQKSAKPIYNLFMESLITHELISEFALVIPARWFGGGKGLDGFRKSMIDSSNIKSITYFEKSGKVFPTVDIDGGVCFVHWSNNYDGKPDFICNGERKEVDLSEYDIIPDDPKAYEIISKVRKNWNSKWVSEIAWSRKPFGLSTDYFIKNKSLKSTSPNAIKCIGRNKTSYYINKEKVSLNSIYINTFKICIPGAYGGKKGQRRKTLPSSQIFIVEPGAIVTETYMVIDTCKNRKHAENLVKFLGTNFARYLLGLRKITQHIPRDRWSWVPYMDISKEWTDEQLFKYFKLSTEEQNHIINKVREWS